MFKHSILLVEDSLAGRGVRREVGEVLRGRTSDQDDVALLDRFEHHHFKDVALGPAAHHLHIPPCLY